MDQLSKLFGSSAKVKIMRLFLFNPGSVLENSEIAKKTSVRSDSVRKVANYLYKSGLIKKKTKSISIKNKKTKKTKTKKVSGWVLDESFKHIQALRNLLLPQDALSDSEIEKKVKKAGKIRLIVVSGAFIQSDESRVDVFLVADSIKSQALSSAIKDLEAHIGTELRYSALESDDFNYRMNIRDKLVRDVFEYPHRVVLDKIGIE